MVWEHLQRRDLWAFLPREVGEGPREGMILSSILKDWIGISQLYRMCKNVVIKCELVTLVGVLERPMVEVVVRTSGRYG